MLYTTFQIIEPSFSRTKFPHDPLQAFDALLQEIRGVHIIDFDSLYLCVADKLLHNEFGHGPGVMNIDTYDMNIDNT